VTALVVALVATSCAYGGTPLDAGALEVGDRRLSVSELTAEIDFLIDNPALAGTLVGADTSGIAAGGEAAAAQERQLAVTLLNLHAYSGLLVEAVSAEGAEISESARSNAVGRLAEATEAQALPVSLSDTLVDLIAAQEVLVATLGERAGSITDDDILLAFDPADPGSGEPTADQEAAALAGAEAAAARLAAGESFETVAAEVSNDTASARDGGSLGCNFGGSFVPEFEAALASLEVGAVSAVVRTQFGFHLIRLDARGVPAYEDIAEDIRAELEQAAQVDEQDLTQIVVETAGRTTVVVNPRFGTWDAEQAAVVAPTGAAPAPGNTQDLFPAFDPDLLQGQ
jgi:hypothetical protein